MSEEGSKTEEQNPTGAVKPEDQKSPAEQAEGQPPTDVTPSAEASAALSEGSENEAPPLVDDAGKPLSPEEEMEKEPPADGSERQPDEGTESPKEQGESQEESSSPTEEPPPASPGPVNTNTPPGYPDCFIKIKWQEGPIGTAGVNGCQLEDVLQGCYKRLAEYQAGPLRCAENDRAISYIQNGLKWLERRTSLRKMQHVEGTNMPHNSTT